MYPHALVSTVKKCALANDRSAQTAAKLIPYQRVPGITPQIVKPIVGVEHCVSMKFMKISMEFIRSGTGQKLYLAGASSELCIHRRCRHSYFLDFVNAGQRRRIDAQVDVLIHHIDAVSSNVESTDASAGEIITDQAGLCQDQTQRVAIGERQFLNRASIDDVPNRGRTGRERFWWSYHFHSLLSRTQFQRNVYRHSCGHIDDKIVQYVLPESGQFCRETVGPRLQTGKHIHAGFVCKIGKNDARLYILRGDLYIRNARACGIEDGT